MDRKSAIVETLPNDSPLLRNFLEISGGHTPYIGEALFRMSGVCCDSRIKRRKRNHAKVLLHLMFGVITLFADQLPRLIG